MSLTASNSSLKPTITSVKGHTGNTGPTYGGNTVTIKGTKFAAGFTAQFDGVAGQNYNCVSATEVTVTAPANPTAGNVEVQVNNAHGLSTTKPPANTYTYVDPTLNTIANASGNINDPNKILTITGTLLSGALHVQFSGSGVNTVAATPTSDSSLTCKVPVSATAETVSIAVIFPGNITIDAPTKYQYLALPVIQSMSVSGGPNAGGTSVTLTGTGFKGATSVSFGETSVSISPPNTSDTSLTVNSPKGQGTCNLLVSAPGGTSAPSKESLWYYETLPLEIVIPGNLAVNQVSMVMYGSLSQDYNGMSNGAEVYLKKDATTGAVDYALTTEHKNSNLPTFLDTSTVQPPPFQIPNVLVSSMRCLIYIGGNYTTPAVDKAGGVTAPTPYLMGDTIFDFFEFSYAVVGDSATLTINTSQVDQFGLPIVLAPQGAQVSPTDKVGVIPSRKNVFLKYNGFTKGTAYAEMAHDTFKQPQTTRILAPKDQMSSDLANGLTANANTTVPSSYNGTTTLTYVLMVTDTGAQPAADAWIAPFLTQFTPASSNSVTLSWSAFKGSSTYSYTLYRGTPNGTSLKWETIYSGTGLTTVDKGNPGTTATPAFDPLALAFDDEIKTLFDQTNVVLSATDGSSNGLQYILTGSSAPAPSWLNTLTQTSGLHVLAFSITDIQNNVNNIAPPVPKGTSFYVIKPFFNSNTADPSNPKAPTWGGQPLLNGNLFPSAMVFGGNGVFADNAQQAPVMSSNSNVVPPGKTADETAYSIILGAVENQLDSAILRGIANNVTPSLWSASPTNLTATAGGSGTLSGTYYYVVTAVFDAGESSVSNEVMVKAASDDVTLNWSPVNNVLRYNIYRGSSSMEENQLVGSSTAPSFVDKVSIPLPPLGTPPSGSNGSAPTNLAAKAASKGHLKAGTTYYYVVTAIGLAGESSGSNEVSQTTTATDLSVALTWDAVTGASAYKIYRGTTAGAENELVGTVTGGITTAYTDSGANLNLPPTMYYAPGSNSDQYAWFFHQTSISYAGLAYGTPYDDQNGQSSTLAVTPPSSIKVTLGDWS